MAETVRKSLFNATELVLASTPHLQWTHARESEKFPRLMEILDKKFGETYVGQMIKATRKDDPETAIKQIRGIGRDLSKELINDPRQIKKIYDSENPNHRYDAEERAILVHDFNRSRDLYFDVEAGIRTGMGTALINAAKELSPQGYLLGVTEEGMPITRKMHLADRGEKMTERPSDSEIKEFARSWQALSYHSPAFFKFPVEDLEEIVHDYESWSGYKEGDAKNGPGVRHGKTAAIIRCFKQSICFR